MENLKIIYPHHLKFMARKAHEVIIMKTCHALAVRGHEVHLLLGKCKQSLEKLLSYYALPHCETLHIHQLPIFRVEKGIRFSWNTVFNYFCERKIKKLTSEITPHLVYLSELKLARYLQNKNIDIPIAYEIHGLYAKEYQQPDSLERAVFTRSDLLITTTEMLKDTIEGLYPNAPKIYKVPLATDVYFKNPKYLQPQVGKECRVVYIGSFYPLQGIEIAISAMEKLPHWFKLYIVGDGKGEEKTTLQKLVLSRDVKENVQIHGFVKPSEVKQWLQRAHILIVPCLSKGRMPFVAHTKVYEYMAAGRPIVASNIPSTREVLIDGVNALLFPPGDVKALVACFKQIVQDPELSRKLAKNAWEHAKKYSWNLRAERLEKCFYEAFRKGE